MRRLALALAGILGLAGIDALLREKHGVADRWVRFVAPDGEATRAVRLDPLEAR